MAKNKLRKKRRLNKKNLFKFFLSFIVIFLVIYKLINVKITNIYVSGNDFLTDQQIIDIAGIGNYPNSINNTMYSIRNKLTKNQYIISASVTKNVMLNEVRIKVKENYPIFYYQVENKTVLYNGDKVNNKFSTPTVINQMPNTIYDKFVDKMQKVNKDILARMSEIKYYPNDVDQERFYIIMTDGNYVYINIKKFLTINKYFEMLKSFETKKGILYLDSGEYFDIFDD